MFQCVLRRGLSLLTIVLILSAVALAQSPDPKAPPSDPDGARRLSGHKGIVRALAFTPDGRILASVAGPEVRLWRVKDGKLLATLPADPELVLTAAFSPDGKQLATAGADGQVRLWDPLTSKKLRTLKGHKDKVTALAFSPDGKLLASGSYDKAVRLWNPASGEMAIQWVTCKGKGHVTAVAFAPDGRQLATASVGAVELNMGGNLFGSGLSNFVTMWEVSTGKQLRELRSRGSTVMFAADGRTLATGGLVPDIQQDAQGVSVDGFHLISLVDVRSGHDYFTVKWRGDLVTFAADGRTFATAGGWHDDFHFKDFGFCAHNGVNARKMDNRLRVWETATCNPILVYPATTRPKEAVEATVVAFSPDGQTLATSSVVDRETGPVDVLLLDLATLTAGTPVKAAPPSKEELETLWGDLASDDAAVAHRAIGRLAAAKDEAVAVLFRELQPVPITQEKRVRQLITDLNHAEFSVRQGAAAELSKLGLSAELSLRQALADKPSLEQTLRLEALLEALTQGGADRRSLPRHARRTGAGANRHARGAEGVGVPGERVPWCAPHDGGEGVAGSTSWADGRAALNRMPHSWRCWKRC
jgi:hypothetical protein